MKRRWLAAAAVLALVGAGCSGAAVEWRTEPLRGQWPLTRWAPAEWLAERTAQAHEALLDERIWCRTNAGPLPGGAALALFSDEADPRDAARFFERPGAAELAWIEALAAIMAERRELPLDPVPTIRLISHDNLRAAACHALLHEDQIGEADDLWLFERTLGINHPDWTPAVLGALGAYSLSGWYSLETKTITLVGDAPLGRYMFETVAHEFVHAMQDQLLEGGIEGLYAEATRDQANALSWVIEGDATVAAIGPDSPAGAALSSSYEWGSGGEWLYQRTGLSLVAAPLYGREFYALYTSGADYVRGQLEAGGWEQVNQLLADPPQSSEQILHPEKLAAREPPIDASRLAALRRQVFQPREAPSTATMGESYLSNLIALATQAPERAAAAAAGWGGDELAVWSTVDGRRTTAAVWLIAFDDAQEHREGWIGLREWLIAHSAGTAAADRSGKALAYDGAAGAIRVVDSAQTVWLIASTDRSTADEITRAALDLEAKPGWWSGRG